MHVNLPLTALGNVISAMADHRGGGACAGLFWQHD
jgi:hypothetical protein